jgi:hydroxylamine dehydrogenase
MSFRSVFIAVVIAFALIVSAFLVNRARPRSETDQPSASLVRASGKCAECHSQQQSASSASSCTSIAGSSSSGRSAA